MGGTFVRFMRIGIVAASGLSAAPSGQAATSREQLIAAINQVYESCHDAKT